MFPVDEYRKRADRIKNGLLTTLAASVSDEVEYALEGSVFVAGAAIQWLRDEMRMIKLHASQRNTQTKYRTAKAFMWFLLLPEWVRRTGILMREARS